MLHCLQLIVYKVIIMTLVEYGLSFRRYNILFEITNNIWFSSNTIQQKSKKLGFSLEVLKEILIFASHNRCNTKSVTLKVRRN